MYTSYYCPECKQHFSKVSGRHSKGKKEGELINDLICPHCENEDDILTNAEFLENVQIEAEEEEKKKDLDKVD